MLKDGVRMFSEYKYKTELHAHTRPASPCSQINPEYMIDAYLKKGYTSLAITNHFILGLLDQDPKIQIKKYFENYYRTEEIAKKCGLNLILGSEIRFTENNNDYLIYGICEEDFLGISNLLDYGIDNFYKEFKNDRNIIIQAHPFRNGIELANPESIDGIEVFNLHPGQNSRIGYAAQFAAAHDFIITCGTDFHHFGHEGICGILTKEPIKDSYQIAQILKSRDYIIDISGYKVIPKID